MMAITRESALAEIKVRYPHLDEERATHIAATWVRDGYKSDAYGLTWIDPKDKRAAMIIAAHRAMGKGWTRPTVRLVGGFGGDCITAYSTNDVTGEHISGYVWPHNGDTEIFISVALERLVAQSRPMSPVEESGRRLRNVWRALRGARQDQMESSPRERAF